VIKPGNHAIGKVQIRSAMEAIAAHFDRSLDVRQAGMVFSKRGIRHSCWPGRWYPRRTFQ
jgi:hypothetical protein